MSECMVTRCSTCRGWVRVLNGKWKVPHLTKKCTRACKGSSKDTDRPVFTFAEWRKRLAYLAAMRATKE